MSSALCTLHSACLPGLDGKDEPGHPDAKHRDGLVTPVSFFFDLALARINEDSPHGVSETVS